VWGAADTPLRGIGADSLATRLAMVLLGAGLHALHLCAVAALCCFPLCCANFESLLIFLVVGVGVIVHWLANTDDWSLCPLAEAHRGLPRSWCWHARAASAVFGALDAFWRRRKYALALALALLCGSRLAALSNRELRAAALAEAAWWQAHAAAAAAWAVPGTVARVLVLPPWLRQAVAMLLLVVLQGALLRLLLSQICGDAALAALHGCCGRACGRLWPGSSARRGAARETDVGVIVTELLLLPDDARAVLLRANGDLALALAALAGGDDDGDGRGGGVRSPITCELTHRHSGGAAATTLPEWKEKCD
jgi:hypothetical protein